jgi:SAM-dependent methyltransferase
MSFRSYFYHNKFMKPGDENILYYNAIANEYNDMVDKKADKIVREIVANKFCSIVEASVVLDFGGGTGLDLEWLTRNNHTIFFCEPSTGMRESAISSRKDLLHDNVIFLDDSAADFRQWHLQLPFTEKVDAVLSNFAVLNCIPDIELLFQNLAIVVKPGGNIITLVLTKKIKGILKGNFRSILKSFLRREPASINVRYKRNQQTVYIHSIKEIIKASREHFNFCNSELLPDSGFTLVHLKRK